MTTKRATKRRATGVSHKTARRLPPVTRELTKMLGEQRLLTRRLTRILPKLEEIEMAARAFMVASEAKKTGQKGVSLGDAGDLFHEGPMLQRVGKKLPR
jgi:hypothetical protein